ncbi:MAG TPA: alanine racemase [Burkholderiaceae bacterium]|nr:alanine racemase [Burkholderiaceae bacterium]
MSEQVRAGALLTIDLRAICDNWRTLDAAVGAAECAAVVKADAYGLGAAQVAPALVAAGCRRFFVAHLDEAIALRPLLPAVVTIYVLHGPTPGSEQEFIAHGVVPVLNSGQQLDAWRALAHRLDCELEAIVQIDTGMSRLGLAARELSAIAADREAFAGLRVVCVMSHLACADEPAHPANAAQLERFSEARRLLPPAPASLAASSGIFLGDAYHFQLARPGAALYGVAPVAGAPNPMRQVVRLQGKVVQLRELDPRTPVGYGHSWLCEQPTRIATVSVGYADGWLHALGNRGSAWVGDVELPIVGRVSMDTITLDASVLPETALAPGSLVDLIGERDGVDSVAARAGTIGYEILTNLGGRYARRYLKDPREANGMRS